MERRTISTIRSAALLVATTMACAWFFAGPRFASVESPAGKRPVARMVMPQARAAQPSANCRPASSQLQAEVSEIARAFDGRVGIAVRQVGCPWIAGERQGELFPQQSVSKLWVALSLLESVDQGTAALDEELIIGPQDLTLFHQPLRAKVLEHGAVRMPIAGLVSEALTASDNTANDRLLRRVGGPTRVREVLKRKGLGGIRFGDGERLLQSRIAGLTWSPELSLGNNFALARARLPMPAREAALAAYLADPVDGATPAAITDALARLANGELLSPESTDFLVHTLSRTRSGPRRLKGGAPPGWTVYHKTGTGQELRGRATGYNDVGLLEAPDGTRYAVAVMVGETTAPGQVRMAMMRSVSAAVARHHDAAGATGPV